MSEQKHKQHQKAKDVDEEAEVEPKKLESDVDVKDILDEIDDVLEGQTEEEVAAFVDGFIQKGGQ